MSASAGTKAAALHSAPAPAPAVNHGVDPAAKDGDRTGDAVATPDTAQEAAQAIATATATAAAAAGSITDGCDPAQRAATAHSLDPPLAGAVDEELTPRQAQVLLALAGCADVKLNLSSIKPQVSTLKGAVYAQGLGGMQGAASSRGQERSTGGKLRPALSCNLPCYISYSMRRLGLCCRSCTAFPANVSTRGLHPVTCPVTFPIPWQAGSRHVLACVVGTCIATPPRTLLSLLPFPS